MPPVNRLYSELKDRGLEVLLVNFREDPAQVGKVAQERGYVAPVLLDRSGDVTGRLYGVWGPPTVYVVDRQGRLVARAVGARNWSQPAARQLLLALCSTRVPDPVPGRPSRGPAAGRRTAGSRAGYALTGCSAST